MIIKGKFEGQLHVMLEFSARDQEYRVSVAEWSRGRGVWDWFGPSEHLVYDDWKGFGDKVFKNTSRGQNKALRYFAKVKAEQAYRHATHALVSARDDVSAWEVLAR